ncbi:TIGR03943 family protein [Lysinibacillus sp. KU-BSD001]|uniref:TIGR03943 family putative permease subunit n=1 Tax=Lysinibacillus sp. KU-BSD001 TaxID=3141328 RepID=UPI0036DFE5E5
MSFHLQHVIKAILLGFFALFFMKLHYTGEITKYINPKYDVMSKITACIFIMLFLIQLFRIKQRHHVCSSNCNHDHGNNQFTLKRVMGYSIIIFPIITGFTLNPATLNATIAANKGSFLPQHHSEEFSLFEHADSLTEKEDIDIYTAEDIALPNNNYLTEDEYGKQLQLLQGADIIEVTDSMYGPYNEQLNDNPQKYIGRKIKVTGFVYKEEGFHTNQFVLSRFMIVHCIADASILGFLVESEEANLYEEDTWLAIEGVLDVTNYKGYNFPVIKATNWQVIDEPVEPYVYPVLTFIQ